MKKVFTVLGIIVLILSLSACGGEKPTISAKNGAYNWTPQDLIDTLNTNIEDTGDSRYLEIPDYVNSGEKIEISDRLDFTLYANDSGYITKMVLDWNTYNESTEEVKTCGLIIGNLVSSISPEDSDEIYEKLDIESDETPEYTTTAESNGTVYTYEYKVNGMYQTLTIEPAGDK